MERASQTCLLHIGTHESPHPTQLAARDADDLWYGRVCCTGLLRSICHTLVLQTHHTLIPGVYHTPGSVLYLVQSIVYV